jgi:hypothetical protein
MKPQPIGGGTDQLKVAIACHSTHLAEIPGIKRISEPRLPNEIYTFWKNLSNALFRIMTSWASTLKPDGAKYSD